MKKQDHKYIFVVGGVMSGVGKGVATSSIAKILQSRGFKIVSIKDTTPMPHNGARPPKKRRV